MMVACLPGTRPRLDQRMPDADAVPKHVVVREMAASTRTHSSPEEGMSDPRSILGLHHITLVTADAKRNVDF